jgi:hypothetical protein
MYLARDCQNSSGVDCYELLSTDRYENKLYNSKPIKLQKVVSNFTRFREYNIEGWAEANDFNCTHVTLCPVVRISGQLSMYNPLMAALSNSRDVQIISAGCGESAVKAQIGNTHGYRALYSNTHGLGPEELSVVMSPPATGKSLYLSNICEQRDGSDGHAAKMIAANSTYGGWGQHLNQAKEFYGMSYYKEPPLAMEYSDGLSLGGPNKNNIHNVNMWRDTSRRIIQDWQDWTDKNKNAIESGILYHIVQYSRLDAMKSDAERKYEIDHYVPKIDRHETDLKVGMDNYYLLL